MKVILIDDDPDEFEILSEAFHSISSDAELVHMQSCNKVPEVLEREHPDLVLLDVNMPSPNGMEALRSVRAHKKFENLPIVMYSTSSSADDINQCFLEHADLYMVKPDNLRHLTESLKAILTYDWQLQKNKARENFCIM